MMDKRRNWVCLLITFCYILFITILSRVPTLTRTVHLDFFWSYLGHGYWRQILLNIALFVPLGYFLATITRLRYVLRVSLATSLVVELTQYFTYTGMLDVDDLISNCLGACVGLLICTLIEKHGKNRCVALKKWMPVALICAGLIGCIMVAAPAAKTSIGTINTKQFEFSGSDLTVDNGKTLIEGECFLYDRGTPTYVLLLDGKEATTTVYGNGLSTVCLRQPLVHGRREWQHFGLHFCQPYGA